MEKQQKLNEFWRSHSKIIKEHRRLLKELEEEEAESLVGKWFETEECLSNAKTFILVLKVKAIGTYFFTYDLSPDGIRYNERKVSEVTFLKEANQEDINKAIEAFEKKISYIKEGRFSDIKKDLGIS
jgi:hypothetical protein